MNATPTIQEPPDRDLVLSLFNYNPDTGIFIRLSDGFVYKRAIGRYSSLWIGRCSYGAHRIAWYYHTGEWPTMIIDHINRDKGDNRIANLRHVSHAVNMKNRSIPSHRSKYRGVTKLRPHLYSATVRYNDERYYLGRFVTCLDAHKAYEHKLKELMGDLYTEPPYNRILNYSQYYTMNSKPIYLDNNGNPLKRQPQKK